MNTLAWPCRVLFEKSPAAPTIVWFCIYLDYRAVVASVNYLLDPFPCISISRPHTIVPGPLEPNQILNSTSFPSDPFLFLDPLSTYKNARYYIPSMISIFPLLRKSFSCNARTLHTPWSAYSPYETSGNAEYLDRFFSIKRQGFFK